MKKRRKNKKSLYVRILILIILVILICFILFYVYYKKSKVTFEPISCPYGTSYDGSKCAILMAHDSCRVAEGFYDVDDVISGECYALVKDALSIKDLSSSKPECVRYACALKLAEKKGLITSSNNEKLCMREIDDFTNSYDKLMDCIDLNTAYGTSGRIHNVAANSAIRDLKNSITGNNKELFNKVMSTDYDSYFFNQLFYGELYQVKSIKNFPDIAGAWASAEFEFEKPDTIFASLSIKDDGIVIYYMRFLPNDIRLLDSGYKIIFMSEKYPTTFNENLGKTLLTGNSIYDPCIPKGGKVKDVSCYKDVYGSNKCFTSKTCDKRGIKPDCDDYALAFCTKAVSQGLFCEQVMIKLYMGTGRYAYRASDDKLVIDPKYKQTGHAMVLIHLRGPNDLRPLDGDKYCLIEPQSRSPLENYGCWDADFGKAIPLEIRKGLIEMFYPHFIGYDYIEGTYEEDVKPADYIWAVVADLKKKCDELKCINDDVSFCSYNSNIGKECLMQNGDEFCKVKNSNVDHYCSNLNPAIWYLPEGWRSLYPLKGRCGTFDGGYSFPIKTWNPVI